MYGRGHSKAQVENNSSLILSNKRLANCEQQYNKIYLFALQTLHFLSTDTD